MPSPKRWFPVSREINLDPEAWELTDRFGDRSLRLWLELLSILDRNDNRFKLSGQWLAALASRTKMNLRTVLDAILWMLDRGWLTLRVVDGEQKLAEEWTEIARKLAGDWPKTHRRLAEGLPETHRKLIEDWSEIGRRVALCASNYAKYRRLQERNGKHGGSIAGADNVPLLSDPILSYPTEKKNPPPPPQSQDKGVQVEPQPKAEVTPEKVIAGWNAIDGVKPVRLEQVKGTKLWKRIEATIQAHRKWAWWSELFAGVAKSKFLTGRKCDFRASLFWVLGPKNMEKTLLGEYEDLDAAGGTNDFGTPGKMAAIAEG